MTVASETARQSYAGNGSTTQFSVPFYFIDNSHVKAILRDANGDETVWVESTDYTLTGAGVMAGGTLTATTAPATGETLVILRNIPLKQETDFVTNDNFPAETNEQAIDKLTMISQMLDERLERALLLKPTFGTTETPASATAAGNPNDIVWDSNYLYICTATNTWKRIALSSW